jgi:frataxin-like iron-binding protein CyaY
MASRILLRHCVRSLSVLQRGNPGTATLPVVHRGFHFSHPVLLSGGVLRRRKRNQPPASTASSNEGEDDDLDSSGRPLGLRHHAVTDYVLFAQAAAALLNKLEAALKPMKHSNDIFLLTRGYEEDKGDFLMLDVGPTLGLYIVQIDIPERLVMFSSPLSGQVLYILSASTGEWCSELDGHAFEGLFVRDIIRQCRGMPNL